MLHPQQLLQAHNAVKDALCDLLTASGQGHAMEMKIPNAADQELRPADILLNSFQDGRHHHCPRVAGG